MTSTNIPTGVVVTVTKNGNDPDDFSEGYNVSVTGLEKHWTEGGTTGVYTYYLKETSNTGGFQMKVLDKNGEETHGDLAQDGYTIVNYKYSVALPATGGIGTKVYTFGGLALILAALGLLVIRKRKED